ncbi:MAG: glycosyltransferase family 4 protein [Clostridia bacterium]|jgi:glycosyltransferase involved in cell wall biosynthesis|nr:glycosyltransferase family 4 protein [Clostridia bacterium]MBT7121643.1 glycosyltransferase family 4 protein [Clostridia bacterium]
MKILIVGQHYYPDNFKINDISLQLAALGHSVTMLTGLPDYATGKVPSGYKYFRRRTETINGVLVLRVPVIARRKGKFMRMLNYASFLVTSQLKAATMSKDFDVAFSYQTSPITMARAAITMKRRAKAKLFLYCLDLWPESLKAWDIKEKSLLFRCMRKYSAKTYRQCDVVGISSLPFKDYLVQNCGVSESRITYLPQHAEKMQLGKTKKNTGVIDLAFGGNIGSVQDVECIIRAVSRLRTLSGFHVHIFGDGSRLAACRALATKLNVDDKITFYGRVDKHALFEQYRKMDAFLLTLKQKGFIGMTAPTKLQEYMSAGKPIIAAIGGAAADIIREADCGLVAPASNDELLAENMADFIENTDKYRVLGENAHRYYEQHFTKEIFMKRLNDILQTMQSNG